MTLQNECNPTIESTASAGSDMQMLAEDVGASIAAISAALTGPLDERLRMVRLAHCLAPALAECCLIELVDPHGRWHPVALVAEIPERAEELRVARGGRTAPWVGQALADQALRSQAPIAVELPYESGEEQTSAGAGDAPLLEALGCRAALIVPIVLQGQPAGAITLGTVTSGRYDERCRRWMAEVGRRAAIAVENARLYAAEREARAEAEEAVRTRDELTALIAHDLRNPLAVVQGQAELLLRQLRRQQVEHDRLELGLKAVRSAAAQMRLLLDDLQDIAHLRAGQPLRLEREPVDLVALARRVAAIQQAATVRHSISVEAPAPALHCVCDARRVERVLANLVGNAIRFSPAGGPVTLALSRVDEADGAWATIDVADAGVGIPEDELPQIFAPFHRARNVIGKIRGTGLGLTSAQAIVAEHRGMLTVASVEGAGSTFTVRLPLEEPDA